MAAARAIRPDAIAVALILSVAACDHVTGTATAGSAAPVNSSSKGTSMSGFPKASAAFRAHAVQVLGTSDVQSGPNNEKVTMPHTLGGAWAFLATPAGAPDRELRGWALADGTVITTQQNFGKLLEQAGIWASPRGDVMKLARAVAWSLGNGYTATSEPALQLGADGAGTIAFELAYQEAGGGGHVSAVMPRHVVITAGKDHGATVKVTRQP